MLTRDLQTGKVREETLAEAAVRFARPPVVPEVGRERKAPTATCVAMGTLCVVGATLPAAPTDRFAGASPDVLRYYPSTDQIQAAGNLAAALILNGVPEVPAALCCGAIPGHPVAAA